ncbi:YegJ family protein [Flavobacterium sp. NPDC079362]|uniref:YegJ family protein n=1 Tax=Flavobacterium sp. NPDC079362 TaxID=3390566 RepID=UPI003D090532
MKTKILITLILFCFISCKNSDKVERKDQPDIYNVKGSDTDMNEAIEKANQTLADFNTALLNPEIEVKSLKVKFQNETDAEHIWLTNVEFKDGKYSGILDNEPEYITDYKIGDTINVDSKNISDWMYIENGKLFGGYTIKVLRNKMSESERKQFDAESGMQIE